MNPRKPDQMRILIAETSPAMGRRLAQQLTCFGDLEAIGPVTDCSSALRLYRELLPEAVVLDLGLPGAGGVEILREIRRTSPTCLVVMLADRAAEGFRWQCLLAGADFFLRKSTEAEDVREILEALMEKRS